MIGSGIRVLVLTSLFPSHPGEKQGNFVLDQVRELATKGAEVTVLVAKPWIPSLLQSYANPDQRMIDLSVYSGERFRIANASFFSLPRFALGQYAARFIEGVVPAIEYLDAQSKFDIIHAHGLPLGHAAVEAAARLRIPSVLTIHGVETAVKFDNTETKRAQLGNTLDRTTAVILVGSPLLDYVRKYTKKTDHCTVIANGFVSYPDLAPSKSVPRSRPVRIVAVSNYEPSKGFELLVEAIASLEPEVREKLETVLVGGGTGFEAVRNLVERLGLADSVHYTGPLPHREAMSEILAADVFCLPSSREAFGIMYAEAMSLGKLTIGCRGQGPSDFIRDRETGLLIEPQSAKAVGEALRWVVANSDKSGQIAACGKTYALGQLTWADNAEKILSLYRNLLSKQVKAG